MTNRVFDKNLPVLFLANVQSFGVDGENDKTLECKAMLDDNQIEVAAFTETWLTDANKDRLPFKNYEKYHHIRKNCLKPSGGSLYLCKKTYEVKKD